MTPLKIYIQDASSIGIAEDIVVASTVYKPTQTEYHHESVITAMRSELLAVKERRDSND